MYQGGGCRSPGLVFSCVWPAFYFLFFKTYSSIIFSFYLSSSHSLLASWLPTSLFSFSFDTRRYPPVELIYSQPLPISTLIDAHPFTSIRVVRPPSAAWRCSSDWWAQTEMQNPLLFSPPLISYSTPLACCIFDWVTWPHRCVSIVLVKRSRTLDFFSFVRVHQSR